MKNLKKLISLALTAIMLFGLIPFSAVGVSADVSVWDGVSSSPFEYGSGTEDDPYLITNAAELAYFAKSVNSGNSYSGEYIKLTTNIKLNDETFTFNPDTGLVEVSDGTNTAYLGTGVKGDTSGENTVFDTTASAVGTWYVSEDATTTGTYSGKLNKWIGIGISSSRCFSGIFDGGNNTISGMYDNDSGNATTFYFALFPYTSYATISNIGVVNSYVYDNSSYAYIGGIIGFMRGGTVQNCYNDCSYIGGISISAESSGTSAYHYSEYGVGGIVGGGAGKISNCFNSSVVYGKYCSAGGILGETGGTTTIENCYNSGYISSYYAAGIVGVAHDGSITVSNCYNVGTILGSSYTGAIIGTNRGGYTDSSSATFSNCYYKIGCATFGSNIGQGSGKYSDSTTGCKSYTVGNLKKQENYEGFDFDTVWTIDSTAEYPYPTLQGMPFVYVCTHDYSSVVTAPTCSDRGYTTYTCIKCGDSYEDNYVSATGHNYSATVTAPTCTEQGFTTYACNNCGDSYTDNYVSSKGHTAGDDATCTKDQTCIDCGETLVKAEGHNYKSVVTAPTCTEQGYTTHACENCGDEYVDSYVRPYGHNYDNVVTSPTCTEQGYTTHTCSACGDEYVDSYVNALGHTTSGEATCTEDLVCSVCGEIVQEHFGHNYIGVVTEPTCTEQGYTTYTCENCGDEYIDDYVDENGHNYTNIVTEPTCTEQGYTTHYCSDCGENFDSDFVDALGHTEGEWVTVTEPEIGVEGLEEQCCSTCGTQLATRPIDALEETPDYIVGDVNNDGKLNATDYMMLKAIVLGNKDISDLPEQKTALLRCDITGDGEIKAADYLRLKKSLLA